MKKLTSVGIAIAMASLGIGGTAGQAEAGPQRTYLLASMECSRLGYMVMRPVYLGPSVSGYDLFACAESRGMNINPAPYPIIACAVMSCEFTGLVTY